MLAQARLVVLNLLFVLLIQRITEGNGQCTDALQNCAQYGQNVCSDPQYDAWATQNCASFCHKCTGGGGGAVPVLPGGGSSSCSDAIQNCAQYGQSVCSDPQYGEWAKQNCARTCNKCGGTGVQPVATQAPVPALPGGGSGSCADSMQNCNQFGQSVCSDPQYDAWARQNCARTCNKCGSAVVTQAPVVPHVTMAPGGVGGSCSDSMSNCAQYGQSVCSDPQYDAWAKQNCARTCNKCTSGGGQGPAIPSQAPTSHGGQSSGCVYKGQIYSQGQTWRDGCQYSCTCSDGTTGKYICQELCYTFNLPPICQMVGPAPGKCCQEPQCPDTVTIQYPPGYVVN